MAVNEAQIFLEGQISPEPILGRVTVSLSDVRDQIDSQPNADSFCIHISSPGGNVYEGYKIFHAIKKAASANGRVRPIRGVIEGEAQSMATFISALADKGSLEIADPSRYMIHNPKQGVEGDSDALRGGADELTMIESEMAAVYSSRTGIPLEQIKLMMKKETKMTAQDAVRMGFADSISKHLRAVALGQPMKHEEKISVFKQIGALFNKVATADAPAPTAINVPLQDGTELITDAPDETSLVNSNATYNGAPAEGEYMAKSGMTIVCVAGKVTAVTPAIDAAGLDAQIAKLQQQKASMKPVAPVQAPVAPVVPLQTAEQKLAAAEAELAKIKAEKEQAMADKAKAEEEAKKVAVAVADVEKKFKELEMKTVGSEDSPNERIIKIGAPVGFSGGTPDRKSIYASRTFIADNMRWLEKHYPNGKYPDGTTFDSYRSDGGPNAVSILEVNFNYTWNGILTTDLFYKPTIDSPALSDLLTIDPGTKDKKQYNIVGTLSKVLQPYFGCTTTPNSNRAFITNKTIQVKEFRMYEGWCKDDFTGQLSGLYNFLAQEWLKTGEASFDPAGTPIDRIIVQLLKDALRRDVFRRVYFADGGSSDTDYNQFDGFWNSLIDQSANNAAYCVYRYMATAGVGLGVQPLAANVAMDYFKGMYNNSALLLKQEFIDKGLAQFQVTRSVWENYYDSVVAVGSVSEQEYLNYLQGIKRLTFRGIPVVPITLWDSFLAESDNPLTSTTRHLIALTPKENHILGIEDAGDLNKIDSWYEKKDSKRYYRADMKLGFLGPIHCELTTIAY